MRAVFGVKPCPVTLAARRGLRAASVKKGVQHAWICAAIAAMSPRMWVQLFLLACAHAAFAPSSLAAPGDVDLSFNPSPSNSVTTVLSTVLQPDGKIIVGGSFTNIAGAARTNLARLNPDGTLDTSFSPNPRGSGVGCIFLQDDGKILIGGSITNVTGVARTNLVRLNADGSLDSSFAMNANNSVYCMAAQADGKIIVGGAFTNLGGQARSRLARLNADGSLDGNFAPSANNLVYSVAVQTDWKIVVGGVFTNMAGATRNRLARINADGTLDVDFNPDAASSVFSITLQSNDKILAGGSFSSVGGASRTLLARINQDGTVDSTFNALFSSTPIFTVSGPGSIYGIALQSDGKILCGGNFSRFLNTGSFTHNGIARLNSTSGTVDTTFDPPGGADNIVYDVTLQPDGNILVGGNFTTVGGVSRRRIARLQNDLAGQRLSAPSADRVEWRLSGSFPETKLVTFDLSTDGGTNWSALGTGIRTGGIWALTNLNLPTTGLVRARARIVGGAYNGSSGLTEAIAVLPPNVPPGILNPIADFTVNEDSLDTVIDLRPVFQDTETPASNLVFTVQYNSNPSLISPAIDANSGTLILHCLTDQSGTATVVVRATDALGGFEEDTFVVTVRQLHDGDPGDLAPVVYPDSNGIVYAFAAQPDGKTIIGGSFTTLGVVPRTRMARLHANGLLDASFSPALDGIVYCIVVQNDGKVVIGGAFTNVNGELRNRLARLNPDGSLDAGYAVNLDSNIVCMALQSDGKLVTGGYFTTANGQPCNHIARLNADGTFDEAFNPNASGLVVYALAVQTDGKIMVGGIFTNIGGISRTHLARLNSDGSGDASFTVNTNGGGSVNSILIQADGKIVVGGLRTIAGGVTRTGIARINADGTIDEGFSPSLGNGAGLTFAIINSMALQADGRLFIGGNFSAVNGVVRTNLARLNPDGTLDSTFDAKLNSTVHGIVLQNDGSLMVGGNFTSVGGVARSRIARLANDPNSQTLTATSVERVEWRLGASSPVAQAVTFEQSTDRGSTWNSIGQGSAFSNGWELAGLALPTNCLIRAKARILGGYANASHGFASMTAAFPSNAAPIVVNPIADLTVNEDSPDTVIDLRAVFQDAETPSSAMEYSVQASDNPILVSALVNNTNGTLTLHCQTNQHGTATIAIRATDAAGLYVETMFRVVVNIVHDGDPGDLDTAFNPNANSSVYAMAVQPDEKLVLAGFFTNIAGAARGRVARFSSDDTLDLAFNPVVSNSVFNTVYGTLVQPDGKIIIGGIFTNVNDTVRTYIARLNADGTLDTGFNFALAENSTIQTPGVYGMAMQPDGKILIGGHFTNIDEATRYNLARLNADGTLDTNFNAGTISRDNSFANVNCADVQGDGRILIGGAFTNVAGAFRSRLARLNMDGSLDVGFAPEASSDVNCILEQPDGKILVGGLFTSIGGASIRYLARLGPDGTVDTSFTPYVNSNVYTLALQADGKIIIGGTFTAVAGVARNRIARLNPDGTLDTGFNPDTSGQVSGVTLLSDGRVVIGGSFTNVGGLNWNRMARLFNEPAFQSLNVAGINRLVLSRSGSSPEAKFVTFDLSTDGGTNWTFLGDGSRISGGWELTGLNLPAGGLVRARARVVGGYRNSSSGLTEATATVIFTSPGITLQPQNQTSTVGGAATFTIGVSGTQPLAYQWIFSSNALAGATNATLALTSVARSNSGYYSVTVTNTTGSVTSSNALLSVRVPQRILPLTALGGSRYRISFSDFGGGLLFDWDLSNLDVKSATDLNAANWAALTNVIVITNGVGQVEFVVTNSPPQQFYRVRMR